MASSKEYLEFILGQLSELEEITYRAMMGEFITINEQIWKIAQNYTANFINESKSLLSFAHWKR